MKLFGNCKGNCHVRRIVAALVVAFALATSPAFAQAVSPIVYDANSLSDARFGVAIATLGELADAPELLARPSSQAFVDDTFARVALTNDVLVRTHADRWREALRVASNGSFDRGAAYASVGDLAKEVLRAVGSVRAEFVGFGIVAEQTTYNARVLHDAAADTQDRNSIGGDLVADLLVPGLKDLRAQLAAFSGHPWDSIADVAGQIVVGLLGSDLSAPFPKSPAVWLVLLRTRTTSADARRHAAHYYLDIVHYDGTHRTIGAYPDGNLAFDHDTGHLNCAFDREPGEPIARTVPVPPGPGSTSAQLAAGLIAGCTSAATSGLRYRVASAEDDRFIADLLFRNGVSVGPILRAAVSR